MSEFCRVMGGMIGASPVMPLVAPIMPLVAPIILIATLFVLIIMFVILITNLLSFQRLPINKELHGTEEPLVSVLVPARDEAQSIERCVRSLVAQTYTRLEVLVLDDHSSDTTAAIVQKIIASLPPQQQGRLRLLQGVELPQGWVGKNFACHQLAHHAIGDYLFFTDADTVHTPQTVASVLFTMHKRNVSMLTAQPAYELKSLGEQLVVPLIAFTIMTLLPIALIPKRPEPSLATGNGQLICFRRDTYTRIGGHETVKNRILEDVLLARATKAVGLPILFADAQDLVQCRMYRSFREVWLGFSKNLFAFYNYSFPFATVALLFNFFLFVLPPLLLLIGLFIPLSLLTLALAAAAYLLAVAMRSLLLFHFKGEQRVLMLLLCFLHPVSIALECLILLNSIRWHYRKRGTVWKGRAYLTGN